MDAAHAVDIVFLARQLKEELATADAPAARSASGCPVVIAEVGALTRNVSPEAYDPYHVSIGPYHRIKNPELARDEDKIRSLGAVLSAASAGVTLEDYLDVVARIEAQARSCYAHTFADMDSNYFVRMLLLDACYVLVHFGGVGAGAGGRPGCGSDMMEAVGVVRDAIYLAENQIPFFVIDAIHKLTVPDGGGGDSAADAVARYIRKILQGQQYSVATPAVAGPPGPGNLLHLLYMHLTPDAAVLVSSSSCTTSNRVAGRQRRFGRWRSATEYYCAGVGFKSSPLVGKGGAWSILDVKLDGRGGTLEIPRLSIDAETPRLLRNLMALEQSNLAAPGSHVTAYCVFLSQLAGTARDVELLSRRGIIAHGLGSHDEVAACLADLCKGVVFGGDDPAGNYLRDTWQALEGSFRSRPRRWAAWLMLRYFRNPWLAVGLAAAALGLVCTVVQAVYAVLAYSPNAG